MMPLYSDPETPKKRTESTGVWAKGLCLPSPSHVDRWLVTSLTLKQGEELFVGCSWQARGSRGARKPNADSRA